MPAFDSAHSDSNTSHLGGNRLSLLLGAATAILALSCFIRHFVLPRLTRRQQRYRFRALLCKGAPAFKLPPDCRPRADCKPPGQGPGRSEQQGSGTAPVGTGRTVEGNFPGSMDEKGTIPTGDWSRGPDSFSSSSRVTQYSGGPYDGRVYFTTGEETGNGNDHGSSVPPPRLLSPPEHAGGASAGTTEKGKDAMVDEYFGGSSGLASVAAASRSTTPFFGHPEDITDPELHAGPSWKRGCGPAFARPPPSPPIATPTYRASFDTQWPTETYSRSVPAGLGATQADITHGGQADTLAGTLLTPGTSVSTSLDSPETAITHTTDSAVQPEPAEGRGRWMRSGSGHTGFPSSYPSTSPLLPPPPSTLEDDFDISGVMFPGAVVADGGTRVVYPEHFHDEFEGDVTSVPADFDVGWKRHTRVYGGGVCLACAAAGGGGFYGARVRPEDKR